MLKKCNFYPSPFLRRYIFFSNAFHKNTLFFVAIMPQTSFLQCLKLCLNFYFFHFSSEFVLLYYCCVIFVCVDVVCDILVYFFLFVFFKHVTLKPRISIINAKLTKISNLTCYRLPLGCLYK